MNTTRFEYLLALEKIGTVSGAAEHFFISPSAMSQCLKTEEEQLGTAIFKRENKKMVPTKAGLIYLKGAREILAIRNTTMEKLEQLSKTRHSLCIAVTPMFYSFTVRQVLPELKKALPDTDFELIRTASQIGTAYILNDLADFALLCAPLLHHSLLSETILGKDQLILAVPKAYLRGKLDCAPSLEDCAAVPFILLKNGTYTRSLEDEILARRHITLSRVYEAEDHVMARTFLEEGRGAAFLPSSLVPDQAEKHFFLLDPAAGKPLYFILAEANYRQGDRIRKKTAQVISNTWKQTGFFYPLAN